MKQVIKQGVLVQGWHGKNLKDYHFTGILKSFQYKSGADQYFVEIPEEVMPSDSSYRGKPVKVVLDFLEETKSE